MKAISLNFFVYFIIACLLAGCSTPDRGVCNQLEGRLLPEVKALYPYEPNLKFLVFSDLSDNEYFFEVIEFIDDFEHTESDRYDLHRERYGHQLYNADLDMYIAFIMRGSHDVSLCPDSIYQVNNLVITTPFEYDRDIGEPEIEAPLILFLFIEGRGFFIPRTSSTQMELFGRVYDDIYYHQGRFSASIRPYFTFEDGVVAIISEDGSTQLKIERIINE